MTVVPHIAHIRVPQTAGYKQFKAVFLYVLLLFLVDFFAERWRAEAASKWGGGLPPIPSTCGTAAPGRLTGRVREVHRVVQLTGLGFQQEGIEGGIAGNRRQGIVQYVPDVADLVPGTAAAWDVLLTLTHLCGELVLQCSHLWTHHTVYIDTRQV